MSIDQKIVPQTGVIYTFTIVYVGFGHMAERAPYVLTIIEAIDKSKLTAVLENVSDFNKVKIGESVKLKRIDEKLGPIYILA
jgi:uncharacterized OB-fold protein